MLLPVGSGFGKNLKLLIKNIKKLESAKITILTLLDNGNREDLLRIKNKFNLSFIQGFSTSNLSYNFNVTGYPSNFLFNSDGQLIRINISTQELNKILSK